MSEGLRGSSFRTLLAICFAVRAFAQAGVAAMQSARTQTTKAVIRAASPDALFRSMSLPRSNAES